MAYKYSHRKTQIKDASLIECTLEVSKYLNLACVDYNRASVNRTVMKGMLIPSSLIW